MIIFKCKCGRKREWDKPLGSVVDGTVLAYTCLRCKQRGRL